MAAFQAQRRILTLAAKLEPAMVVMVRAAAQQTNPNARVPLRDATAPAPKVPVLNVWDKAIHDSVAAAKPGPMEATVSAHVAAPIVQPVKLRNVAGVLRGTDPQLKDTYVIVTGHYDHLGVRPNAQGDGIYNGANDDASGAASVIAIAGALAELEEKPKRTIVFVTVFGEEVGGLGARWYTGHPIFPIAKTVADINLEQLGRTDDSEGPKVAQFNLTGFDYTDIAATFAKVGAVTGVQVIKHEKNSDSFFSRSDNATFADAGIPSTTLSVSYIFPDYHQPGDEWQKLDYDNLAKVDVTVALGILDMANSAQAPQWNKENPKTARYVQVRENGLTCTFSLKPFVMGCRRPGAAPAVQPQGPCRNAEVAVQDVPPESRSGREHDHRATLGLHAVPLRDQGRQSGDSKARSVCHAGQTSAVGADLRDSGLGRLQPPGTHRSQEHMRGLPRQGGRTRCPLPRSQPQHGHVYGLPRRQASQRGMQLLSRTAIGLRPLEVARNNWRLRV